MTATQTSQLQDLRGILEISRGVVSSRTRQSGPIEVLGLGDLREKRPARRFLALPDLIANKIDVVQNDDVLVGLSGSDIADTWVVQPDRSGFVPSQQAAVLRVLDPSKLDPWFLGAWLRSPVGKRCLQRVVSGASVAHMTLRDLKGIEIALPKIQEQTQIATKFKNYSRAISAHGEVMKNLGELLDIELGIAFP